MNDRPFAEVSRSQPYWYESEPAWGDLCLLDLGDIELRRGDNTLTLRVTEPTLLEAATAYALSLDRFTLRRRQGVEPRRSTWAATAPGTYRYGEPASLTLGLTTPTRPHPVRYTVTDYFGHQVAAGIRRSPPGTDHDVALPHLPPGHYRVRAER